MSRRPWKLAVPIALAAVYLPTLVPFAAGELTDCGHCVANYLRLLPIVPGWMIGAGLAHAFAGHPSSTMWLYVAGGAITLALVVGLLLAARRLHRRDLIALCVIVMPLVGVQAHWLGAALRA